MKRIIVFLCALMMGVSSLAQNCGIVFGSVVWQGGYNVLEKQPITDLVLNADIGIVRGRLELGLGILPFPTDADRQYFKYLAHSIGLVGGEKHLFYALVGATPWGGAEKKDDKLIFKNDVWHAKVEGGTDLYLSDRLLLNLEIMYMFPRANEGSFKNLCLRGGLGIKF